MLELEEGDGGVRKLLAGMWKRNVRLSVNHAVMGVKSCYNGIKLALNFSFTLQPVICLPQFMTFSSGFILLKLF